MCLTISFSLFGCKEKGAMVSVFDGIPESTLVTEVKTSLENKKPLAIAFTAEWCPHCRKYKPMFAEVKEKKSSECTFINIDVDDQNGSVLSSRFRVSGIPTTAFVRADGSVFKVQVGEIETEELAKIVDNLVKNKKKKRSEPIAPFPIEPIEAKAPAQPKDEKPLEIIKQEGEEPQVEEKKEEVKQEDKEVEINKAPEVKEQEEPKKEDLDSGKADDEKALDNDDVDEE